MRETCLYCVIKHLGKALVNLQEVRLGFPQFMLLVIGNLSEAEDESLQKYPEIANKIRDHRKKLMANYYESSMVNIYDFPFFDIYNEVAKQLCLFLRN